MRIKLSGIAAEILKTNSIDYSDSREVKTLLESIQSKSEILRKAKIYVSINGELASNEQSFGEKDKVLVFNPFTGG
ncbi:MAG: MoaD/ThiS family protein [Bacteroidales bacterium]|nr:MoaD/ThiS family protein [Bacteroidales bacterium]MCF8389662.1 MoaD/ThiS family protein [Bacteroidales bacterium]